MSYKCLILKSIRVCPETSYWIAQLSEHEADRGEAQEGEALAVEVLPILGEPAAAIEPCDGALDDPSLGQDRKSFDVVGALDDLGFEIRQHARQAVVEGGSLIGRVGKELGQDWMQPEHRGEQQDAAIAVLDVGGMNDGVQQQAECIYEKVALLALDFLARIIARRVDPGPPFSALFTLWLSIMAAVGLASRSLCSRHST